MASRDIDAAFEDRRHRFGDRHFDPRAARLSVRIGAVQAPSRQGAMSGGLRLFAAPNGESQRIIARLRRGTGQGQVSKTRQAHDRFRPRALRRGETHQFGEAARQQRGMGAGAKFAAHGDAAGDGQHIFRRAANFDADQIARPVEPEMRRRQPGAQHFREIARLSAASVTAVGRPRARSTAKLGPDSAAAGWPGRTSANTSRM